jgi:phenylalanyl-tRNA synthetase alpha chain
MAENQSLQNPKAEVEAASKAFEREFERFASLLQDSASLQSLSLSTAESELNALGDLRTRHLGKKSATAMAKKLIGRVSPDERAEFGQLVQRAEAEMVESFNDAEARLKGHIEALRIERESIDVTLPGRRPRRRLADDRLEHVIDT